MIRCWCGYLSAARCRLFAYGPAMPPPYQKPHDLLPHLNPDWFNLSGTGLSRLSWKRGRQTGAVVVVYHELGDVTSAKLSLPLRRSGLSPKTWFFKHFQVHIPNSILIVSAVIVWLVDTQTTLIGNNTLLFMLCM